MMTTAADVWSALPYSVRHRLASVADAGLAEGVDNTVWTLARIQVTPWALLPLPIRELIHDATTCQEME